jgi:hypothetical protein
MTKLNKEIFKSYEPLKSNRWVVRTQETFQNIPEYAVSDFKIDTLNIEGEKTSMIKGRTNKALRLTLHFRNMVHWMLVPDDVINAKKIKIDFLGPVGDVSNYYDMDVEFDSLTLVGDYSDSSILTHEVTFWIKSMDPMAIGKDIEEETLKNYKKNKEEKGIS